jgi:diaminopimelate epimerase
MRTTLFKAHGLGNDYLVLESGPPLDPARARALCDRHRGPGADGVLEPLSSSRGFAGVRIWNPDGSVAEKSGNGLRIFAFWLRRHRSAPAGFAIEVGPEVVDCEVEGCTVELGIGRARFDAAAVPVDRARIDEPLEVGDEVLDVVTVGIGNPHCVILRDEPDLDALPWRRWGEAIERHPAFPNRTNVQVARVTAPRRVEARVWERGAGPTLASGSSACAVAAAAVRTGRIESGPVVVEMPGGELLVTVREDWSLRLRGPVMPVGRFELDPEWS